MKCWWLFVALIACSRKEAPAPPPAKSSKPLNHAPEARPAPKPKPPAQVVLSPSLQELGVKVTASHERKRFTWRQLEDLNWQASSDGLPKLPSPPESARLKDPECPPGMVHVAGKYLLAKNERDDVDDVLVLQNRTCSQWRTNNRGIEGQCDAFDSAAWRTAIEDLPHKKLSFCIDRYEFPNRFGEFPVVATTYGEARKYCERADKRLCSESEWTFACEGEQGLPYPYGLQRDKTACNIDVLAPGAPADTYKPRTIARTATGIDIAWQGKRSGESARCVSPFGVYDMTGNVDEWTESVRKYGYRMILKGGHWGPARQRCRPQTRGHGPRYLRHDQGFRCCRDTGAAGRHPRR